MAHFSRLQHLMMMTMMMMMNIMSCCTFENFSKHADRGLSFHLTFLPSLSLPFNSTKMSGSTERRVQIFDAGCVLFRAVYDSYESEQTTMPKIPQSESSFKSTNPKCVTPPKSIHWLAYFFHASKNTHWNSCVTFLSNLTKGQSGQTDKQTDTDK